MQTRSLIALPDGGRVRLLALGSEDAHANVANLVCEEADGRERWRIAPRMDELGDCFVHVELREGALLAWTWSCFRLTLDPQTGAELASLFVK